MISNNLLERYASCECTPQEREEVRQYVLQDFSHSFEVLEAMGKRAYNELKDSIEPVLNYDKKEPYIQQPQIFEAITFLPQVRPVNLSFNQHKVQKAVSAKDLWDRIIKYANEY